MSDFIRASDTKDIPGLEELLLVPKEPSDPARIHFFMNSVQKKITKLDVDYPDNRVTDIFSDLLWIMAAIYKDYITIDDIMRWGKEGDENESGSSSQNEESSYNISKESHG